MAGPDWYEKVEEVPNGRTRLVRIFFGSTQYQDHWVFSKNSISDQHYFRVRVYKGNIMFSKERTDGYMTGSLILSPQKI